MKVCVECGNEEPDDMDICPRCGSQEFEDEGGTS